MATITTKNTREKLYDIEMADIDQQRQINRYAE